MMLQSRTEGLGKPSSSKHFGILCAVVLWLVCCAGAMGQQSVSLGWDPDADPSVAGYALCYGTASHVYSTTIDVGTNTTATVSNLQVGQTYYFAVTAYDSFGVQSQPSSEVSYQVQATTGSLLMSLGPSGAVSGGAEWQVDGGAWQTSGTVLSGLSAGNHTVTFNSISGWNTPANQIVAIAVGATNNSVANYTLYETTPPTVAITSPATNSLQTSNAFLTLTGKAADNGTISAVYYQLNGSVWTPATTTYNWTTWTAPNVGLRPGTNFIQVRAVDTSGNVSTNSSLSVFYVVRTTPTVHTKGAGTLNTNYNGVPLALNKNYSMTAAASPGFAFAGWSGSLSSTNPTLNFLMASNLQFMATFVDVQKPTVAFITPSAGLVTSNASLMLSGKAADNVAVAQVYWQLNGSGWTLAGGTSNWTAGAVSLTPGTNILQAYAVDTSGNVSATGSESVFCVVRTGVSVQIKGAGTLNTNYNGAMLALNKNYSMTATASPGFAFAEWSGSLTSTNPTLTFLMASNLQFTATFVDVQKPTVAFTSPTAGLTTSNANWTPTGKAADNVAVAQVYWQLNGSGWTPAATINNWTNWTGAGVTLTPGTNIFQAYAVDTSGNVSATGSESVFYVVRTAVSVQIKGAGTLNTNYNGAMLALNKNYSMTAKASTGFAFAGWSGSLTSTNPTLTFLMASNLQFTATFVDVQKPTVTITSPTTNGLQTSNTNWTLTGKAADNVAVAQVYWQLNGSGWTPAATTNNWTNWTGAGVTLTPGTNIFQAYAVDTSGNVSATGSKALLYVTAPNSLSGSTAIVSPNGGIEFSLSFGSTTFSQQSTDTNNPSGVGTYTYTKLSPSTAQLKVIYTAPPTSTNDDATLILNFTANSVGMFTNVNGGGSGAINLSKAPSLVPASVNGQRIIAVDLSGDKNTLVFGSNTFTLFNDSQGGTNSGNYSFSKYSPVGSLLKLTGTNGSTNYVILTFSNTNQGNFFDTDYHVQGNPPDTDFGAFAIASQSPKGNAPSALAGLNGQVTLNGSTFTLTFGTNTFSQSSADTNVDNGVGTYVYSLVNSNLAGLTLLFSAPPSVTNNNASVYLSFVAGNFGIFTNQNNLGSNIFGALSLSPAANLTPASVIGKTITASYNNGVVDTIQFNGDGTFSQFEIGSSQPGSSSGTYTFTSVSSTGAMLQLSFANPVNLAGSTAYIELIFSDTSSGSFSTTDYDNLGDSPTAGLGSFILQ